MARQKVKVTTDPNAPDSFRVHAVPENYRSVASSEYKQEF